MFGAIPLRLCFALSRFCLPLALMLCSLQDYEFQLIVSDNTLTANETAVLIMTDLERGAVRGIPETKVGLLSFRLLVVDCRMRGGACSLFVCWLKTKVGLLSFRLLVVDCRMRGRADQGCVALFVC